MEAKEKLLGQEHIRENVDSWQNLMFLYQSAMREVCTKLEILKEEFQNTHRYNPIEYIESRLKTPESIVKKLQRNGKETTMQNMVEHVSDIAGVRIVCSFTTDIYLVADMIRRLKTFEVLVIKDYIRNPKPSGYRSYHMILNVPVHTTRDIIYTKVEVQIRTIAMDFWASLEHKIQYKFEGDAPDNISRDLRSCARIVSMLDEKMLSLNEEIRQANGTFRV
jgi:putative GTP pyrophosphokinase